MPQLGTNSGHGHVWTRPDGLIAMCGGPAICSKCAIDAQRMTLVHASNAADAIDAIHWTWIASDPTMIAKIKTLLREITASQLSSAKS